MHAAPRLAVIGGGWAGLSAAVAAVQAGAEVTLHEMAPQLGGRARSTSQGGRVLDNGQHILIGAYRDTLALMRTVGVDPERALLRRPLQLAYPDGRGLSLPPGPSMLAFARGVAGCRGWTWGDRLSLLAHAARWGASGFVCAPQLSVAQLCAGLAPAVRELLVDPLCVAALNTPASEASAAVFLRVLKDALFGGPGSADLLLPQRPLDALLPAPAGAWLAQRGARIHLRSRVERLQAQGARWRIGDEDFDGMVLACPALEAARLVEPIDPGWSAQAAALRFEPIVTAYVLCEGGRLPAPMMALLEGPTRPAQFVFDLGLLAGQPGLFACVVSGAARWVEAGLDATGQAATAQLAEVFPDGFWPRPPSVLTVVAEKRATFRCTPALARPPARVAARLVAAADYTAGPYPATLEGAVRAGRAAATVLVEECRGALAPSGLRP